MTVITDQQPAHQGMTYISVALLLFLPKLRRPNFLKLAKADRNVWNSTDVALVQITQNLGYLIVCHVHSCEKLSQLAVVSKNLRFHCAPRTKVRSKRRGKIPDLTPPKQERSFLLSIYHIENTEDPKSRRKLHVATVILKA